MVTWVIGVERMDEQYAVGGVEQQHMGTDSRSGAGGVGHPATNPRGRLVVGPAAEAGEAVRLEQCRFRFGLN